MLGNSTSANIIPAKSWRVTKHFVSQQRFSDLHHPSIPPLLPHERHTNRKVACVFSMGKNKQKKLARKAASEATATNPARNEDAIVSETSQDAPNTSSNTEAPYSSEGPTLPIIGGMVENAMVAAQEEVQSGHARPGEVDGETGKEPHEQVNEEGKRRARKKRKLENGSSSTPAAGQIPRSQVTSSIPPTTNNKYPRTQNLTPLHKPWTFLPPAIMKSLQARLSSGSEPEKWWSQNCIPVVFFKNQNIKTGINKLKTYLGAHRNPISPIDLPEALDKEERVIAVSAQGEAIAKMASIVEVLKRVVGDGERPGGAPIDVLENWYLYTSLGSIQTEKELKKKAKPAGRPGRDNDGEEEAFQSLGEIKELERAEEKVIRLVPVLTVWMSKTAIREFRDEFGETNMRVLTLPKKEG